MTIPNTAEIRRGIVFWVIWPLFLAVLLTVTRDLYHLEPRAWMYDMKSYIAGVGAVLGGTDPYLAKSTEGEYFVYPPFALIPLLPIGWMSLETISFVSSMLNVAALQLCIFLSLRKMDFARSRFLVLVSGGLTLPLLLFSPVDQTINLGQVNLVLLAMVLLDLSLPANSRWKGVFIGLAAGIKIVPAIFVLFYLIKRQYWAVGRLLSTAAGTVVLGFIVFPRYSYDFWTEHLYETTRVAQPDWLPNESLRGMWSRTLHSVEAATIPWLVSSTIALALAVMVAKFSIDSGEDVVAITSLAVASLLIAPVSWHHHWVWQVPITIYLIGMAVRSRSLLLWISAVVPPVIIAIRLNEWFIPGGDYDSLQLEPIALITTNVVTYSTIALLVALAVYSLGKAPARSMLRWSASAGSQDVRGISNEG